MEVSITENVALRELCGAYKAYRVALKKKNDLDTKYYEGKLDTWESLYRLTGGCQDKLEDEKEKIDELINK